MKHISHISRRPAKAQGDLCSGFESDYQVLLCFLLEVLQIIFPFIEDSKTPTQSAR
ncbi:MAG: hypothetical protein Q8N51_19985 [Gammaproteobacteria bacterium]|nr:hypothetical protein [Gammaproteobacteria bacterium]